MIDAVNVVVVIVYQSIEIIKLDCVGHYQKHVGTRLQKPKEKR